MYTQKVLNIFKNPAHVGRIMRPDGVGEIGNAKCGDIMKMYLRVNSDDIIEDAKFQTFGCAAAIASTSVACDLIIGKHIDEALKLTNQDVLEVLGELPQPKIHCSLLAEQVIRAAVENYIKNRDKYTNKQ